ncbi:MAG: efflux RND transporter permease subunit [Pseudomonadota bacterium]
MTGPPRDTGPIAWMAGHSVAPNLLMLVLLIGGFFFATQIRQEVFPSFETDIVSTTVKLPGAAPAEVEQSVVLAVEDALADVIGIDELTSSASEGSARIYAELGTDRPAQVVFDEIAQAVDRITTLPEDAEEPVVNLVALREDVIDMLIYGDVDERSLRMAAETLRTRLLQDPDISDVVLEGVRDLEIHVEIPPGRLRALGLTLPEVAETIRRTALERSGGTLETAGGEILLRLADRRDTALDFARIPVITDPRGTVLRLGDIATVRHGFADTDAIASFNGKPAIRLDIYRVGKETPISVSDAVRRALPKAMGALPAEIESIIVVDDSEIYRARMELLMKNGFFGLVLVLLILSLFLEFKLAFWVAVGIPTAFLGTFLFLPWFDVSVNMVTMFAFILALGIVVDDAIVAGENIYEYRERGMGPLEAAIQGARDIAVPLSFSILTNIAAFLPLAMVPGGFGKFWVVIPMVVGTAFLLSWIEALFVLPAHLAGVRGRRPQEQGWAARVPRAFAVGLDWVVERIYGPLLRVAMEWRYTTVALMIGVLAVTLAWPLSDRMGFTLFPSVPRDNARISVAMPVDAPLETRIAVRDQAVAAAERIIATEGDLAHGIYALVEEGRVRLRTYLVPEAEREMSTSAFARAWREQLGEIPAARSARFTSSFGGPGGSEGIEIDLSHDDPEMLRAAATALTARLAELDAVRDPEDGITLGKRELTFRLTDAGRAAGLTSAEVAEQVRAAFFGAEALSQQDGRHEVSVRVRLPEAAVRSEQAFEGLILRLPEGGEIPLAEAAVTETGRAEAQISRTDRRRVLTVTASIEPEDETTRIVTALEDRILPQLAAEVPGLGYRFGGSLATKAKTIDSFKVSITLTLLVIYALLAIPFRSYIQPAIVMAAIPFGLAGAILGHLIMDMSLSMVSIFGAIALGGVVINAAIVMIDYANKRRDAGASPFDAMWRAGKRRFRPILLTTVTTFGGLAPMIFETSAQARFLVPMAVSLGYGILFATAIVLFLIPCLYVVVEDLRWLARGAWRGAGWALFPEPPRGRAVQPAPGSGLREHP